MKVQSFLAKACVSFAMDASLSDEARERRLANKRARRSQRLASETAEEQETRLSRRRAQNRAWHATHERRKPERRVFSN